MQVMQHKLTTLKHQIRVLVSETLDWIHELKRDEMQEKRENNAQEQPSVRTIDAPNRRILELEMQVGLLKIQAHNSTVIPHPVKQKKENPFMNLGKGHFSNFP